MTYLSTRTRDSAARAISLTDGWVLYQPSWGRDLVYENEDTEDLALVIDRSEYGDFVFSDDTLRTLLNNPNSCIVLRDTTRRQQVVAVELAINVALNLRPEPHRRNRQVTNGWWIVDQSFKPIDVVR